MNFSENVNLRNPLKFSVFWINDNAGLLIYKFRESEGNFLASIPVKTLDKLGGNC